MAHDEEVQSLVSKEASWWISFLLQFSVLFDLKSACHANWTLWLDKALLKDERSILLHIFDWPPTLLWEAIFYYIEFLNWRQLLIPKLFVFANNFPSFLRHDVIELSSEVFRWKAKILGQNYISQYIFTISLLYEILILTSQALVHSTRLEQDQFG